MIRIAWLALGLIHLLPAAALFRPALLRRLYGVEVGSVTFTLLQHRAALFLGIVVICLWAAIRPEVRPVAVVCVGISMGSFLVLWWQAGAPVTLRSIAVADLIGLPVLLAAAWQAFGRGN